MKQSAQQKLNERRAYIKAQLISRPYHIIDSPQLINQVCNIRSNHEQLEILSRASFLKIKNKNPQFKQNYKFQDCFSRVDPKKQRNRYTKIKAKLIKHINFIQKSQNLTISDISVYEQQILALFLSDFIGQLSKQCRQKAQLLYFIWDSFFSIIKRFLQQISLLKKNDQKNNLTNQINIHNEYLKQLEKHIKKENQLQEKLSLNEKIINNLVYSLRHKKKQIKNLYQDIRSFVQNINQFKDKYFCLQNQHIYLLMEDKSLTKQVAEDLVKKKMQINKARNLKIKPIHTKSKNNSLINKEFKAEDKKKAQKIKQAIKAKFIQTLKQNPKTSVQKFLIKDFLAEEMLDQCLITLQQAQDGVKKLMKDQKSIQQNALLKHIATDTKGLIEQRQYDHTKCQTSWNDQYELQIIFNKGVQTLKHSSYKKVLQQQACQTTIINQQNHQFTRKNTSKYQIAQLYSQKFYFEEKHRQPFNYLIAKKQSLKDSKKQFSRKNIYIKQNKQKLHEYNQKQPNFYEEQEYINECNDLLKDECSSNNEIRQLGNNSLEKYQLQIPRVKKIIKTKLVKKDRTSFFAKQNKQKDLSCSLIDISEKEKDSQLSFEIKQKQSSYKLVQKPQSKTIHIVTQKKPLIRKHQTIEKSQTVHYSLKEKKNQVQKTRIKNKTMSKSPNKFILTRTNTPIKANSHKDKITKTGFLKNLIAENTGIDSIILSYINEYKSGKTEFYHKNITQMITPIAKDIKSILQLKPQKKTISTIAYKNMVKVLSSVYSYCYQLISRNEPVTNFVIPLYKYFEVEYGKIKNQQLYNRMINFLSELYLHKNQSSLVQSFLFILGIQNFQNKSIELLSSKVTVHDMKLYLTLLQSLGINWNIPLDLEEIYTTKKKLQIQLPSILQNQNFNHNVINKILKNIKLKILNGLKDYHQSQNLNLDLFRCTQNIIQFIIKTKSDLTKSYQYLITLLKDESQLEQNVISQQFLKYLLSTCFEAKFRQLYLYKIYKSIKETCQNSKLTKDEFCTFCLRQSIPDFNNLYHSGLMKFGITQKNAYLNVAKRSQFIIHTYHSNAQAYKIEKQLINKVDLQTKDYELIENNKKIITLMFLKIVQKQASKLVEQIIGQNLSGIYYTSILYLSDIQRQNTLCKLKK